MWWLLVPIIGAVVAAVASSDDDDKKEAAERRARSQAREAEAQAIARRKQESLEKRKAQLVADTNGQLRGLFTTHSAVFELNDGTPLGGSFVTLKAFAVKNVPIKPSQMLKHLEAIAPGIIYSQTWLDHAAQAQALKKEIEDVKRLEETLLGQTTYD